MPSSPPAKEETSDSVAMWSTQNSPGWYRVGAVVTVIAIALFAALATIAALVSRSSSNTIETSTAPSLIGVQDLSASVAEANAAATAVFLSGSTGEEDRGRRNLYLDALRRSAEQTEEVAGLVDSVASHDALKAISVALTDYSGQIEASRLANQLDQPNAANQLRAALDLTQSDIGGSVATITARGQNELDDEASSGDGLMIVALLAGLLALLVLIWLQLGTYHRSNRVFNVALVGATLAIIATLVLISTTWVTRNTALDNAQTGGYDSIASTSRLQASVFAMQSELSLRLLGAETREVTDLIAEIDADVTSIGDNADSIREQAAATELSTRWIRYRTTAEEIIALAEVGRDGDAVSGFQGQGLSTFNGLNTSIESVLSDNRTQFTNGVADAADAAGSLPIYTVILPVLAALATIYGVQRRLGDYQ